MRKIRMLLITPLAAAALALPASGCATRGFVRAGDAAVDAKTNALAGAVDETQAHTSRRIDEADGRAREAAEAAQAAHAAGDAAQASADAAGRDAAAIRTALGTLITEVTISEAQGGFAINRSELPPGAHPRLDQLVRRLEQAGRPAFLEIEGHTDDTGGDAHNLRLGLRRAEAVKRYLHERHDVPLHRMSTFSHGESRPAAANDSPEGRARNRRVVIRVRS